MTNKHEDDKKPKWEQPEIEDFQEDYSEESEDYCEESEGCDGERVVVGTYQKGCYPMPYGFGVCSPRKGVCHPYGYGNYHCAPRHGCYPYLYYSGYGNYCRPYGFNYGYGFYGYGCYPRR